MPDLEPAVATLARIESLDFRGPMFMGEMAVVCANIVFTSPHSILVAVRLHAENILKGNPPTTSPAILFGLSS